MFLYCEKKMYWDDKLTNAHLYIYFWTLHVYATKNTDYIHLFIIIIMVLYS